MAHDHAIAHGGETRHQLGVTGARIAEVVYPPRLRVPTHTHAHAHLGFLLAGSCRETVGRRVYDYTPRHLVVKGAGESHHNEAGDSGTRFLIVDLDSTARTDDVVETRALFPDTELAPILRRMLAELRAPDEVSTLACDGLVLELLAGVARARARSTRAVPGWVPLAGELIHDRAAEPLVFADLARELGVHPTHFARGFRRHFGRTPGEYLRSLRLARAMALLAETDRPLRAIARLAGFSDQSHLTRALRREIGLTPAAYRRRTSR